MPSATAPQQANSAASQIATFLQYARTRPYPTVSGSIPSGSAGGSASSQVSWTPADIPDVAAYCEYIDLYCNLAIQLTVPASGSVQVSPYAPYSALQNYFTVAGQSQWEYMSGAPFWLDELTSYEWFDPAMSYPTAYGTISGQWDNGSSQTTGTQWYPNIDGSGAFKPGATISNTTGSSANYTGTLQFRIRVRLRRRQANLSGMVPLGDPENRPQLFAQLSALVGTKPADCLFVSATSGVTAVLSAAGSVWAVFRSKSLDLLPPNVATPTPAVGMALQINTVGSTPITQAGTIIRVPHRTAMIYDKIFHCLYNNQVAQAADYFGTWTTDDQQTARWYYDAAENSYQELFETYHDAYKRYFPVGCLIADYYSGDRPEFPAATPYKGEMSPDSGYAALAGVRVTPAMNTAFRIPSGTTLTSPGIQVYEFGLVTCTY